MPNNRYFLSQSFIVNQEIQLQDQEFHHLRHVCRGECGDTIELINGQGDLALASVTHLSKDNASVKIVSLERKEPLPFTISLALAFLKPSHLEYAIEKATEIGVSNFWLFPGDKSEKKQVSEQYLKRLQSILQGATKQCGRLFMPELHIKPTLKSCCHPNSQLLFGDFGETAKPLCQISLTSNVCLIVGPESGFSANERKTLVSMKATPISMHPYTLRAETAAIAGSLLLFNKLYTL